jgi:hypothetical protein
MPEINHRKRIAFITSGRSDYSLIAPILNQDMGDVIKLLMVTGAHLSKEFGKTLNQIDNDGHVVDDRIDCLMMSNNEVSIATAIGLGVIKFSEL